MHEKSLSALNINTAKAEKDYSNFISVRINVYIQKEIDVQGCRGNGIYTGVSNISGNTKKNIRCMAYKSATQRQTRKKRYSEKERERERESQSNLDTNTKREKERKRDTEVQRKITKGRQTENEIQKEGAREREKDEESKGERKR